MVSDKKSTQGSAPDTKVTNEKPIAIPLDFEDALEVLLNTPPNGKSNNSKENG